MTTDTPRGEIVIYQAPDGGVALDVRLQQETIWLNLNQLSTLLGRDKSVISRHLRNIYKEGGAETKGNCCKICNSSNRG